MGNTRPPYPAQFREQMVELAREFGVIAQTVANWVCAAGGQAWRSQATAGAPTGSERE